MMFKALFWGIVGFVAGGYIGYGLSFWVSIPLLPILFSIICGISVFAASKAKQGKRPGLLDVIGGAAVVVIFALQSCEKEAEENLLKGVNSNNPAEAVKYYRKAAEQGSAEAEFMLGRSYTLGEGVEKNAEEALKWIGKSADHGYAPAQKFMNEFLRRVNEKSK